MRLAIMQPYFIPYAGYFRLFTTTDLFVIYDCVQFARRGWVHRNQIQTLQGAKKWLTLPIAKCPQKTLIHDLSIDSDTTSDWQQQMSKIYGYSKETVEAKGIEGLYNKLSALQNSAVDYLEENLKNICGYLQINCPMVRSSSLNIDPSFKGQERILEICRHLQAKSYINSPGGRDLYNPNAFQHQGIQLLFLNDYQGKNLSILQRILLEDKDQIRHEIHSQSSFA